jgi:hypothetical protein
MSLTNSAEASILALYFNATAWADIAENDTSSPATALYLSAHTADPGETGDQTTSETSYGSYARINTTRNGTDWPLTSQTINLGATESWPAASSGTATLTHFGIGTASSGAGRRDMNGTITANISVATGVTPQLTTATSITLD